MSQSKNMYKVEVEGQEAMLVPSQELAETMAALFDNAIITPMGRKDASAFVRQSTAKVEIPSIWLGLLADVKTLIDTSETFGLWANAEGDVHSAVALCAVLDAHTGDITMTVKRVDGKASEGKAYFDVGGQQFDSLARYIHLNGGKVTSLYPAQAARQYNRVDGEPKSLKQKEA